jgi:hypothetical protein
MNLFLQRGPALLPLIPQAKNLKQEKRTPRSWETESSCTSPQSQLETLNQDRDSTSKAKAATSRGAGIDSRKSEGERKRKREVGDCGREEEGSDV